MQLPLAVLTRPADDIANDIPDEPPPPYLAHSPPVAGVRPEERERRKRVLYEAWWRHRECWYVLLSGTPLFVLLATRYVGRDDIDDRKSDSWVRAVLCVAVLAVAATLLTHLIRVFLVKRRDQGLSNSLSLFLDGVLLAKWTYIFVSLMASFAWLELWYEPVTWSLSGIACLLLMFLYAAKVATRTRGRFEKKFGALVDAQIQSDGGLRA